MPVAYRISKIIVQVLARGYSRVNSRATRLAGRKTPSTRLNSLTRELGLYLLKAGFNWPFLVLVAFGGSGLLRCSFSWRLAARARHMSAPSRTIAPIAARAPDNAAWATGGTSTTSFIRERISWGSSSTHCAIKEKRYYQHWTNYIRRKKEKFFLSIRYSLIN